MKKLIRITKRFIKNIIWLLKFDLSRTDKMLSEHKYSLLENTKVVNKLLFNQIDFWYESHKDQESKVKDELEFLRTKRILNAFPYPSVETEVKVETGFDENRRLPFVIHNSKRLYFTKGYSEKTAGEMYKYYIVGEKLLGFNTYNSVLGGVKSPHKYQSETVCVENDDILLDIGCAEALFALDNIEKVSKVYLFESSPAWYDALEATFEPYKNKVVLIKKLVSDVDDEKSITLKTALQDENDGKFFMKMDIEGFEEKVIQSSREFLMSNKVKISACTYHLFDAQDKIPELLNSYGYNGEFSDGYMLFYMYDYRPPFLRKGVYRAKNF